MTLHKLIVGLLLAVPVSARAAVIQKLDFYPHQLSGDGKVVYGTSTSSGGDFIRWTASGGKEVLGKFTGLSGVFIWGASRDGGVVVGQFISASAPNLSGGGFYWSAQTGLQTYSSPTVTEAIYGVSGDGNVWLRGGNKWTAQGKEATLPFFGGAASYDGSVIAGGGSRKPYRYTSQGVVEAPTDRSGPSRAITPDGSVIAGYTTGSVFVWAGDQLTYYPYENPSYKWIPIDISADGRTVVGFDPSVNANALLNENTVLHDGVQYTLPEYLGLEGWTVNGTRSISDDGTVIIASGYTDHGVAGPGLIAYVPEPHALIGALFAAPLVRRSARETGAKRGRGAVR
jgi:hypothetical protein